MGSELAVKRKLSRFISIMVPKKKGEFQNKKRNGRDRSRNIRTNYNAGKIKNRHYLRERKAQNQIK